VQGDFGQSFYHRRPVSDVIAERLPATIELSLVALIIALVTSIPLGVLAAIKKNSIFDRIATVGSLLGVSLPGFWFGILLLHAVRGAPADPAGLGPHRIFDKRDHADHPPAADRHAAARAIDAFFDALSPHHPARHHAGSADDRDPDARHPHLDA
jgi:ABC-type dipeptide/oligopeptide/nickel transport system permease component